MQAVQFAPATLKVKRGDTVVWTNRDPFPHTATAAGVFDRMLELTRRRATAFILVTHDESLAERCDRTLHLVGGRLVV